MKILLTSGGTKIPIDKVRDITNMSTGTFGSKIATELMKLGQDVYFFKAKGSKSPMSKTIDLYKGYALGDFSSWHNSVVALMKHYKEMEYATFDEYKERLERLVKMEQPDVVVLAAAVSDYGVENPFDGKVRSNDMLSIKLIQLPKLIYLIKEWLPSTKVVGFKMLVNSTEPKLMEAAKTSIRDNNCSMIVANDLSEIREGNHKIHLVFPDDVPMHYITNPNDPNYLARMVAENVVKL